MPGTSEAPMETLLSPGISAEGMAGIEPAVPVWKTLSKRLPLPRGTPRQPTKTRPVERICSASGARSAGYGGAPKGGEVECFWSAYPGSWDSAAVYRACVEREA